MKQYISYLTPPIMFLLSTYPLKFLPTISSPMSYRTQIDISPYPLWKHETCKDIKNANTLVINSIDAWDKNLFLHQSQAQTLIVKNEAFLD